MMSSKRWIEGTVGSRKRPGAYCTRFRKSRSPRVYMTYTGGASDVITLAHELGHAFHAWVMRELPACQHRYGASIAETASTFGETVVRNALLEACRDARGGARYRVAGGGGADRVHTEYPHPLRVRTQLLRGARRTPATTRRTEGDDERRLAQVYGDSLAEPDPLFWANKLHFYISGLSFYNFPYLFGYLFSLGVYARREAAGAEFFPRYEALLQDTGRTTARNSPASTWTRTSHGPPSGATRSGCSSPASTTSKRWSRGLRASVSLRTAVFSP